MVTTAPADTLSAAAADANSWRLETKAASSKPNKMKLLSQRFRRPMGTWESAASKSKSKKNPTFSEV